jgi:hypothetical protein
LRCNDIDDGLLGHVRLGQGIQQGTAGVVFAGGQGPGDAGGGPTIGLRHGPKKQGQGFAVDQLGQRFDVGQRFLFLGRGQGCDKGLNGSRSEGDQFCQSLLRQGAAWIAARFNLGD